MIIKDKVFVITGGGNGIGREVVLELLRRGARVAAVDMSEAGLAQTAELAAPAGDGSRLSTHTANLADRAAVEALPAAVQAAHGQIDGLVHVAGIIQRFVPVAELTFEDIDKVISVNLWGTLNVNKVFLAGLLTRPAAALVNISSMGGLVPFPGQTAYSASKGAVKLWTEGLQAELANTPVAVTVVFPGAIATDIAQHSGVSIATAAAADSPVSMTAPGEAARQIVEAIAQGKPRVRIGKDARLLDRLVRLMPTRAILIIAKKMASAAGAARSS